jgi:hypothetical protein
MTRARGQPSRTLLDREYSHQLLVLSSSVGGRMLDKVIAFHAKLGIPTKSRSLRKDDAWYSLYCFAYREHAELFQVMFGGELVTQAKGYRVPRWTGSRDWAKFFIGSDALWLLH